MPFKEPLHILGSGSIGLLWAASIRSAVPSYPLTALFRSHYKSKWRFPANAKENQILVSIARHSPQRPPRVSHVPVEFIGDQRDNENNYHGGSPPKIQNVILCTKAYQATDALQSIIPRLDRETLRIMVLCNGALAVRENIKDTLSKHKIYPQLLMCTTTQGVYQEAATTKNNTTIHLVHVGMGRTFLGGRQDIARLWDQSGLNAQAIDPRQMEVLLWQKLAANCVCNPLTALWGVPNGKLAMHYESFASLRKQVVREVSLVGTALHPELELDLDQDLLDSFVEQVIQENSDNKSSMFRDVQNKQQTEIDQLNGYIVMKGNELGIETPANSELVSQIHEVTASYMDDNKR
jgi:2-dehydropantoate 2-reductase